MAFSNTFPLNDPIFDLNIREAFRKFVLKLHVKIQNQDEIAKKLPLASISGNSRCCFTKLFSWDGFIDREFLAILGFPQGSD